MSALASRVDEAVARLPEDEQRVLALRERESADYRAIAARFGVGREGVADLLVSARLAIWSGLHGESVPARRTPSCGPARRVLAAQADGETVSASDADRARDHLAQCDPCRTARLALREAELACRAWRTAEPSTLPPPPSVSPRGRYSDNDATRTLVTGRRRLVAALVAVVVLLLALALIFGGGDPAPTPAAPQTGPGSAQGSAHDVVPPPGTKFCPDGERTCK